VNPEIKRKTFSVSVSVLLQPSLDGLNAAVHWSMGACVGSTTVMATAMQTTVSPTCDCNRMLLLFNVSFSDSNGCPSSSSLTNAGGYILLV
jgi:hypothetical protein